MQDTSIKNIVLLMAAVGKANNLKLPELIRLEGFNFKAKKDQEEKENAIGNILKGDNIGTTQKVLALLSLFSLGKGQRQNTELYYSVLPLLSTICMIIRSGKGKSSIKGLLSDLSLHRIYPMSSTDQVVSDDPENNITSNEELSQSLDIDIEDEILDDLIVKLIQWRETFIKDNEKDPTLLLPPYLLGRTMTRFTSALINASNKENLAELFQQHLILFLNSVMIEEAKEKFDDKVDVNNNNPVGTPQLLYDNLGKAIKIDEDEKSCLDSLAFIRCLLSCPLISVFFKEEASLEIKKYIKNSGFNDITLFDILSRAKFETKENALIKTIDITNNSLKESLERIMEEKDEEFFRTNIYDVDNLKAYYALKSLSFVNSIGQGCTKRLKDLYKKEYIDKQ